MMGIKDIPGVSQQILDSLEPLFERAEREDLWFRHTYYGDDVVFSPAQFRASLAKGEFRHGAINWQLIPHPKQKIPTAAQQARLDELKAEEKRIWDSIKSTPIPGEVA